MTQISTFSPKQLQILTWWLPESPYADYSGIICDGAIRSGKTFPMSISFVEWAMSEFNGSLFAICGKTVSSVRRNILTWLIPQLMSHGYKVVEKLSEHLFTVTGYGKTNTFYVFGGKDESSYTWIQGMTLSGVLFDEVALMPESFINQATGRCLSVRGAKFWFNCNPGAPNHYFKRLWLDDALRKKLFHLHFLMYDNPSLDADIIAKAESLYHGVFYKRYIKGEWVAADGVIFDSFTDDNLYDGELPIGLNGRHCISIDYGTQNAFVLLYYIYDGHTVYVDDEYYYSGRELTTQKTNSEYLREFEKFHGTRPISRTIIDPSAASFRLELRRSGYRVTDADNDVLEGIRHTSSLFGQNRILISRARCKNLINKLQSYVWQKTTETNEEEKPLKLDDDPCDALRYFIHTMVKR